MLQENFKKYHSLENTYRKNEVEKVFLNFHEDKEWILTEKIHGANYTFLANSEDVIACRRTGIIPEGEKFYNHTIPFEKYQDAIKQLVKDNFEDQTVRVVGELYGKGVQREVYYKDEQDFVAFDIFVDNAPVNYDTFVELCEMYSIPMVPVIKRGTFSELIDAPNTFETLLSDKKDPENITEGWVLFSKDPVYDNTGSRLIFKSKNEKFSEKKSVKSPPKRKSLSEDDQQLFNLLSEYLTENRVNNVISKIGNITTKDFGKIQGLFVQDVLEDFEKDSGLSVKKDKSENWEVIKRSFSNEAAKVVRPVFKTLI